MRQVYAARDAWEANWIKAFLERAGIEAAVRGDQPGDAVPELAAAEPCPTVLVRDADELDARMLVEAMLAEASPLRPASDPPGLLWTCPACSAQNREQDLQCERCGHTRRVRERLA